MSRILIGTSGATSLNPIALLIAALFILSLVLLYIRIRSWGVEFTPTTILRSVLTKDRFSERVKTLVRVSFRDIFLLRRAGAWCEEGFHKYARGLLMWGFVGLLAFSFIGYLVHSALPEPLILNVLQLLIDASKLLVFLGAGMLLSRRLLRKNIRNSTDIHTWLLQVTFLLIGLSGLIADMLSFASYAFLFYDFYILYIASFAFFFAYYPFSELAFLIWKGSLLTQESLNQEMTSDILAGKG